MGVERPEIPNENENELSKLITCIYIPAPYVTISCYSSLGSYPELSLRINIPNPTVARKV